MEKKVKISDYEEKQHHLLIALNSVGIPIDYPTADLVYSTITKLREKGGSFNILDGVQLKHDHHNKWENYFKSEEDEENI